MLDLSVRTDPSSRTVVLKGEATIAHAKAIHGAFLEALRSGLAVRVDTDGLTEVDASFLQILAAAARRARTGREPLSFEGGRACRALVDAVEISGFRKAVPLPASATPPVPAARA